MAKRKNEKASEEHVNDVRTLSPKSTFWDIGDKPFEQKPLTIDRLGDIFEEIVDILIGSGTAAILDQLTTLPSDAVMPIVVRMVASVPKKLPKVVALALDAPKEERYIREHVRPRQAVQIIRTFIVQNEVAALMQDFFELAQEMRVGIESATKELTETDKTETDKTETDKTETNDYDSDQSDPVASEQT